MILKTLWELSLLHNQTYEWLTILYCISGFLILCWQKKILKAEWVRLWENDVARVGGNWSILGVRVTNSLLIPLLLTGGIKLLWVYTHSSSTHCLTFWSSNVSQSNETGECGTLVPSIYMEGDIILQSLLHSCAATYDDNSQHQDIRGWFVSPYSPVPAH